MFTYNKSNTSSYQSSTGDDDTVAQKSILLQQTTVPVVNPMNHSEYKLIYCHQSICQQETKLQNFQLIDKENAVLQQDLHYTTTGFAPTILFIEMYM